MGIFPWKRADKSQTQTVNSEANLPEPLPKESQANMAQVVELVPSALSNPKKWANPVVLTLPDPPTAALDESFSGTIAQRTLYFQCKEDPQPVLVLVGQSKCWQLDRRLLGRYSEFFETSFKSRNQTTHFEQKNEDPNVFERFATWLYSWEKEPFYAFSPQHTTSFYKTWIGVAFAEGWFLADKLGATEYGNFVLGWYIQAVIDGTDSSLKANKLIANTMARLMDTPTLNPALHRFAREWTEWCIASDLEIAQVFKNTELARFEPRKREDEEAEMYDPRCYAFDHWSSECGKAPSTTPQCSHIGVTTTDDLPAMKKHFEKPKRDYYGEVRNWAINSLPKLTTKNIGAIVSVAIQLSMGVSMMALAVLLVINGLEGVRYQTGTYALFVACLTTVLSPFPLAGIPGFFAFCGGIASAVDTVTCKTIASYSSEVSGDKLCGWIEAQTILQFLFAAFSPLLMWIFLRSNFERS